jgi:hypothetical protein
MAHCLGSEGADKIYIDRLGLESLPVEILDDLSLIDLHEVPKGTEQKYENRNLDEKVANLRIMQSPYQVGVFGEEYISSREYYDIFGFSCFCFSSRELTFGGTPYKFLSEKILSQNSDGDCFDHLQLAFGPHAFILRHDSLVESI